MKIRMSKGFVVLEVGLIVMTIFGDIDSLSLRADSVWWHRLTYMTVHANLFHLASNSVALWFFTSKMRCPLRWHIIALLSAIAVPSVFLSDTGTVGLSGYLYGMIGITAMHIERNRRLRFVVTTMIPILASMFMPNVNGLLHLWGFGTSAISEAITLRLQAKLSV